MLDALACVDKLKKTGIPEEQARAQVEVMTLLAHENLASKMDIKELEVGLKKDIELIKRDIKELEVSLRRDIKELELKFEGKFTLLNWMLGVTIAGVISLVLKAFFG